MLCNNDERRLPVKFFLTHTFAYLLAKWRNGPKLMIYRKLTGCESRLFVYLKQIMPTLSKALNWLLKSCSLRYVTIRDC